MLRRCALLLLLMYLQACGLVYQGVQSGVSEINQSQLIRQGRHGELTEQELTWANTAWRYFINNTQLSSGLVNSIDNYPTMDMAALADYLIALQAAIQFELISTREHDERLTMVIDFLRNMPLTRQGVPNKVYSTSTKEMVNYANQSAELGWSAIDIGRLLIALAITKQKNPQFAEYIDKAVLRWNFCSLVSDDGQLYGGNINQGQVNSYKEGRLGIEEYASYGYLDWQIIPSKSISLEPYEVITINGIDLLFDGRDPRFFDVLRPVFSTPFLWLGLEFNWDDISDSHSSDASHSNKALAAMADSVYQVQQSRWELERIYTARGEHVVSGAPYFVYDAIYALGTPWITVAEDGSSHDHLALVSTRVAFQMWALWRTEYTTQLLTLVQEMYHPQRGWYEGRYESSSAYEKSITIKTNAGILEALLYKQNGKLYQANTQKDYRDVRLNSRFEHPGKCLVETFR
ncbi:conserved hypothetical protein [Shewanella halifaxensis HAW-EB4]|uniref:DUF3131 domain-containing protein n=1 Tax=Shewanella halifaxensis (strain HAW-EB4) TaxID=458817 RepID=B0TKE8_SHEHH|nr:DUF3131 domain-containing protein [Shewanella halifaxensis]ABZ78534.1 conserved hypothetical protein [Shewanella halifaxensis HAW-EB4]